MKLTKTDREILACAYFQADAPIPAIAKRSGFKEHVVRHSIQKMLENDVICRYAIVNPHACGYHEFYLMFSFALKDVDGKRRAVAALQNSPEVSFLGEFGGDFQYGVTVNIRHPLEIVTFLDRLSAKTGPILLDKKLSIVVSMTYFRPEYIAKRSLKPNYLAYDARVPVAKLDDMDHRVLRALMSSEFSSNSQLAREIGIPNSTLDYRIKTLKERGILAGIVYFLNTPHMLEMQPFSILVHFSQQSPELRRKIFEFCAAHRYVHYLAEDVGGSDCEIGARFEQAHHVSAFVDELDGAFKNQLSKIVHFPYLRRFKLKFYPFGALSERGAHAPA